MEGPEPPPSPLKWRKDGELRSKTQSSTPPPHPKQRTQTQVSKMVERPPRSQEAQWKHPPPHSGQESHHPRETPRHSEKQAGQGCGVPALATLLTNHAETVSVEIGRRWKHRASSLWRGTSRLCNFFWEIQRLGGGGVDLISQCFILQ